MKRKTLKETDILDALTETEFDDLVPLVKSELEAAKVKKANKVVLLNLSSFLSVFKGEREERLKSGRRKGLK